MLQNGTDIHTVNELLSHSDLPGTGIYTHLIGSRRAGAIDPLIS